MQFLESTCSIFGMLSIRTGNRITAREIGNYKGDASPRNPERIKQYRGLAGYYRKFIPHIVDIARPLTTLSRKEVTFEQTSLCQEAFAMLKKSFIEQPILF